MDTKKLIDSLKQSFLFQGLDESDLREIVRKAKVREYFPGENIVWQGQQSRTLYLILNGIVAVKNITNGEEKLLAYLMPGNTFGEVGILENQVRSASVSAVSEVDALVIQRDEFLKILEAHSAVAIQLARMLGQYLVQSSRRLANEKKLHKVILVIQGEEYAGATSISTILAERLYENQKTPTAYFEYPNAWRILGGTQVDKGAQAYHHVDGYDILLPKQDSYLPPSTQASILLDRVRNQYNNIVIVTNDNIDDATQAFLEHANQVIIISTPTKEGIRRLEKAYKFMKGWVRQEEVSVITILSRSQKEYPDHELPEWLDYQLPNMENFPTFGLQSRTADELPEAVEEVISNCMERLDRTNSIGIFIPTTTDVNRSIDTTVVRERTLSFMAERFGGATCKEASGVWLSEDEGLVGEMVYIVHSYITHQDLALYLDEVVDYVRDLKDELKQEAMALEVNQKLTLI